MDQDLNGKTEPSSTEGRGTSRPAGTDMAPRIALAVLVALLIVGFAIHVRWLLSLHDLPEAVSKAGGWLRMLTGDDLPAVSLVIGPFVALLATVTGLLVHYGMPQVWQSARRSLQVGGILGACLAAAWFIGTTRLAGLRNLDWLFFIPIVPPALLAFQVIIMWRQRPRSVGDFRIGVSSQLRAALEASGELKCFQEVHAQLLRVFGGVVPEKVARLKSTPPGKSRDQAQRGSSTPTSFATQFAVPGLLLLLVGFGAMSLAASRSPFPTVGNKVVDEEAMRAVKWGVGGAYTYVLFTFGSRSFRTDLTVGAATWAMITLITGPILAVVLGVVWSMKATGDTAWQSAIVLFFAGLAPRRVMTIVEGVALQFLRSPGEAATSKLIPLTSLRGISADLAVRLREENVEDVTGLAYADPIRLVQNMPYDLRQVVEWIDQAQLAVAAPDQYETLQQRGVTGAIDLAWRWLQACVDPASGQVVIAHAKAAPASFKALVREPEREAELLYETGRQMFYEEQVRLLWVMYNCFSTAAGDQDLPAPGAEPIATASSTTVGDGVAAPSKPATAAAAPSSPPSLPQAPTSTPIESEPPASLAITRAEIMSPATSTESLEHGPRSTF